MQANISRYSGSGIRPLRTISTSPRYSRQAFIDPEEPRFLRRVEVGRAHGGGPAIFAAPRMHIFVRDQVGHPALALLVIEQVALAHAVQARGQVFQS